MKASEVIIYLSKQISEKGDKEFLPMISFDGGKSVITVNVEDFQRVIADKDYISLVMHFPEYATYE